MEKRSKVINFKNSTYVAGYAAVGSKYEKEGRLGGQFDYIFDDPLAGKDSWEQAESELQKTAFEIAVKKSENETENIDVIFAGDLLNQCVGSTFGIKKYDIPFVGVYGACSTMALSLIMASAFVDGGFANLSAAITSSHYCSAERQFRFPLEYGGQRTPTSQWTVTGSGAFILSSVETDRAEGAFTPCVTELLPGYVTDRGINNVNNMGAAMAPAAADTLFRYFKEGDSPDSFDMIITGDLGREGSAILTELLSSEGIDITKRHVDCGCMIYNADSSDKHAGGSGCGCSAVVMASNILAGIENGTIRNILFVGTGALMSPLVLNQGSTIPGIGHLIHIVGEENE